MNATSGSDGGSGHEGRKRRTDPETPQGPTHLDAEGRAKMVDVGAKQPTRRVATATALIVMPHAVREALIAGDLPKGEAMGVARIAGIQAAKETSRLIPLCHPLSLDFVEVGFEPEELVANPGATAATVESQAQCGVRILATAGTTGRTGVEMEALAAATVAGLTIYDMVKGLHRGCSMQDVRLLKKEGGVGGPWSAATPVPSITA